MEINNKPNTAHSSDNKINIINLDYNDYELNE